AEPANVASSFQTNSFPTPPLTASSESLNEQVQPESKSIDSIRVGIIEQAKWAPSEQFFRNCSNSLLQLLLAIPPDEFMELQSQISVHFAHADARHLPRNRVSFLLCFLPYAIWKLPAPWIDEQAMFLEQNADLIDSLDDYDFLLKLLEYHQFLTQHDYEEENAVLQPLGSIIQNFFQVMPPTGNHNFCHQTARLLQDPSFLMNGLSYTRRYFLRPQLECWTMLAHRVALSMKLPARLTLNDADLLQSEHWPRFLADCRKRLSKSRDLQKLQRAESKRQAVRFAIKIGFVVIVAPFAAGFFSAIVSALERLPGMRLYSQELLKVLDTNWGRFIAILAGIGVLMKWLGKKSDSEPRIAEEEFVHEISKEAVLRIYREQIRDLLLTFVTRHRISPDQLLKTLVAEAPAVASSWDQPKNLVPAIAHVAALDPAIWWLHAAFALNSAVEF
ncbi:MAG: hypothetical protein KDA85_07050, partial [Planctomycetaceae bacterium]|nr:hypothetical protein [Planctomycetaceae bacterium]